MEIQRWIWTLEDDTEFDDEFEDFGEDVEAAKKRLQERGGTLYRETYTCSLADSAAFTEAESIPS